VSELSEVDSFSPSGWWNK